jgi:hypothetical protein
LVAGFLKGGLRETSSGTFISDVVIVLKAYCFAGDTLAFEVKASDCSRLGCDLFYRTPSIRPGAEVARAKTAIVFSDPRIQKPNAVPG